MTTTTTTSAWHSDTEPLTTEALLQNVTTTTRLPRTPPPLGYFGDTKVMLWKVLPPIIISWGTIGNLLTLAVLIRQIRKSALSSTTMYFFVLALSDTAILWCGPFRNWLKYVYEIDVRYMSDAGCKIQLYVTYASIHLSSWLLVAVTMERVISVWLPHKVRIGCTPRTAAGVILTMVVCIFGLNSVLLVIVQRTAYSNGLKCGPSTKEYLKFRDDIWEWIDFSVAFAVPALLLIIGNIMIIVKLVSSRRRRQKMSLSRAASSANGDETRSVSLLLVSLCVIFLLTMTPATVYHILYPAHFEEVMRISDPYERWYAYQYLQYKHAVVNIVSYTNAAFNFMLYVFSGSKFRGELASMFCCGQKKNAGVSRSKTTTTSTSITKTEASSSPSLSK